MAHSQPEHKKHDIFAAGKANDVSNRFFGEDEMRGSESNAKSNEHLADRCMGVSFPLSHWSVRRE